MDHASFIGVYSHRFMYTLTYACCGRSIQVQYVERFQCQGWVCRSLVALNTITSSTRTHALYTHTYLQLEMAHEPHMMMGAQGSRTCEPWWLRIRAPPAPPVVRHGWRMDGAILLGGVTWLASSAKATSVGGDQPASKLMHAGRLFPRPPSSPLDPFRVAPIMRRSSSGCPIPEAHLQETIPSVSTSTPRLGATCQTVRRPQYPLSLSLSPSLSAQHGLFSTCGTSAASTLNQCSFSHRTLLRRALAACCCHPPREAVEGMAWCRVPSVVASALAAAPT